MPATTCSTIEAGSSERGLSDVITARSESSAAARPINGRLSRSRSPPQPSTEISFPSVSRRAASSTFSTESGVWA